MEEQKEARKKEQKPIFDTSRPIAIKLHLPDGPKVFNLRYPTDEEWIERETRKKIITRQTERGQETEIDSEEADDALMRLIMTGENPECSPEEASLIIARLAKTETQGDPQLRDGFYSVPLKVPGGMVEHILRIPTAKERRKYDRDAFHVYGLKHRQSRTLPDLRVMGTLYRALKKETIGYANGVPVIHQADVVVAVFQQITEDERDGDFF